MSDSWKPLVRSWAQEHAGIVSIDRAMQFGASRRSAYRLADGDDFALIMPGVLRSTHTPLTEVQLMTAACVRNPDAVIALTTAAKQWKFRSITKDDAVYMMVPHGTSPIMPGVTVVRCRRIDPVDIVERADGLRITSPPRTVFDCADKIGRLATQSNVELLLDTGKCTMPTLVATATRLASPTRPGSRTMREVLQSRPGWSVAVQSELELLVLNEIRRQGLPDPVTQYRLDLATGSIRFDFAWPDVAVALEVDHPYWHAGAASNDRDKRRDRQAAAHGWLTVRLTDLDVSGGLAAAIREVAMILKRR